MLITFKYGMIWNRMHPLMGKEDIESPPNNFNGDQLNKQINKNGNIT